MPSAPRRRCKGFVITLLISVGIFTTGSRSYADCADDKGCSFPYVDGNCVVLGCCGGDGERQCCVGCIGSEAPSACAPGNVVEADLLCHTPCVVRKSCAFPYADGNCPALGCCGGEGERVCVVGLGSDAPSECQPGLNATATFTCQRPRTIGQDCGPSFPCQSPLQCVPFVQKCAPDAGDQIIDEASCLAFYSQDLSDLASTSNATMSYGISAAAAAVAGGSYEVGNVYGQDGRYGCFLTYCYGVETDVAISSSVCVGISDSWEAFGGESFSTVAAAGAGVEFTTSQNFGDFACFTSDPSPPCLNGTASCIGAGIGLVPFSVGGYQCMTIVNTVLGGTPGNTPPTALCQNVSLSAGTMCNVAASIDNGSSDPDAGDMIDLLQTPPGPYGPGTTQVTLAVTDTNGAASTCMGSVTVTDSTSPAISGCPSDVTVNTGAGNAVCGHTATWVAPSASDNCGVASFTSNYQPGSTFPVGDTTVTYTAMDAAGLSATCSFKVHVIDNTVPVVTGCPFDVAAFTGLAAGACSQAGNWVAPTADDNCDIASFTSNHQPGNTFAVGETNVTYTAIDTASLTATCTFKVTVLDDTVPVIAACPTDRTVQTGPGSTMCSQTASWTAPTANDNCGATNLTSTHAQGATFAVGETTVTYTAKDAANNTKLCSFKVTAVDNTPPQPTCPSPITVEATSSEGASVAFAPTAFDNCSAVVVSSPTSGSVFPIGTTTVTSTATDPAGNQSACSFAIHVIGADLAATKMAGPDPVIAGTSLTYTIQLANDGPDSASNVTLTDQTPTGTTFASITAPSGWSCATPTIGATGQIICTKSSVANGEMATFTLLVDVPSSVADGATITNHAEVISSTQDPMPLDNEGLVTTTVMARSDIVLTSGNTPALTSKRRQAAQPEAMALGGGAAYPLVPGTVFEVTFTVTNNGASDAQGVMISAPLPTHIFFVELLAPAGWTCTTPPQGTSGLVSCSTPTLVAGASAPFTLKLKIDPDAPSRGRITGTLTVSSATGDPMLDNNVDSYYVDVFLVLPVLSGVGLLGSLLSLLAIGVESLVRHRR